MEAILICGYSKTGKDTLYKQLAGISEIPFNWITYYENLPPFLSSLNIDGCKRGAFADILKQEVNFMLNVPEDYESKKDMIYKDGKTLRDHYIEHAAEMRKINPDHWVEKLILKNSKDVVDNKVLIITDFRYPNELERMKNEFSKVVTIRVFNSKLTVPDASIISEHQLDDISTDFLLVRTPEDFDKAVVIFPQYKNYVQL